MTGSKLFKIIQVMVISWAVVGCVKAQKHKLPGDGEAGADGRLNGRQVQFKMYGGVDLNIAGSGSILQSGNITARRGEDVKTNDQTGLTTRREYNMELCGISDPFNVGSLLGQKFEIYSQIPIVTPNPVPVVGSGNCLNWTISLPFNYFGDSVYLGVDFVFRTVDKSSVIHKTVWFNPWDGKRGSNFEFYDYSFNGLTEDQNNLTWARGLDDINKALAGNYTDSAKVLEIGSVNIQPVSREAYSANTVGADVNMTLDEVRAKNDRLKLSQGHELTQTLDLHLELLLNNLVVRLKRAAGGNYDEAISSGRYKIEATLIGTGVNNQGHYILSDKMPLFNQWRAGAIGLRAVLPMTVVVRPQWGNLNLILKVEPLDLPGVQPFNAIYHLGTFDQISGGKSPIQKISDYSVINRDGMDMLTFNYEDYLKNSLNYDDWLKGQTAKSLGGISTFEQGFQTFMFTPLTVLFGRIMAGDTATDRTIQYTVNTCVVYNFIGRKPGAGLVFDITTEDRNIKSTVRYKTDVNGCLNWVGMISHKFYQRERLIDKISEIKFIGDESAEAGLAKDPKTNEAIGEKYSLKYYINPWDEKFTFGRDARALPIGYISQIEKDQEIAPATRILMTDFRYDATGFRYVIDKYMNMTVKKTVLMTIHPKILKYNSILWGRGGFSELRDGIYLMKVAMQKDYLDPTARGRKIECNAAQRIEDQRCTSTVPAGVDPDILGHRQFLTIKEVLVRVLGGLIVTPIEFDVDDLRTLRIRSQMLIQLETIDETLLRTMMLLGNNLDALKKGAEKTTVELTQLAATEEEIKAQIDALMDQAKTLADQNELAAKIKELEAKGSSVREHMQRLLGALDPASLQQIIDQLNNIRRSGQYSTSVADNVQYKMMNEALIAMKQGMYSNLTEEQQPYGRAGVMAQRTIQDQYRESQSIICKQNMQSRLDLGKNDEALQWWDNSSNKPGQLCVLDIPADQLFYYLASFSNVGSEAWLRSIFSPAQMDLYLSGHIMDDFTKAYKPQYSFDLLSNQGDERSVDENASGLPRRTFIGPVTFVLNGNGSALRPTDVLDEYACQGTCAQPSDADQVFKQVENDLRDQQITEKGSTINDAIKAFNLNVNAQYEDSPYYGSVSHFYMKQVNDLIPVSNAIDAEYEQEMKAFAKVGNMVEMMNYHYVSFAQRQTQMKMLDYSCYAQWKAKNDELYTKWRGQHGAVIEPYTIDPIPDSCFVNSSRVSHKNNFLRTFNNEGPQDNKYVSWRPVEEYGLKPVAERDLKEFSKNGLMSPYLTFDTKVSILHNMCRYLQRNLVPKSDTEMNAKIKARVREKLSPNETIAFWTDNSSTLEDKLSMGMVKLSRDCHNLVNIFADDVRNTISSMNSSLTTRSNPQPTQPMSVWLSVIGAKAKGLPMSVQRKVRVVDTTKKYIYREGKTINYSVGTSFSMSNTFGINRGFKLDPVELLEKTLGLFGGKAIGGKIMGNASGIIGAGASVANFGWAANESESSSNGTSVGSNTTIAGQISTLDIELAQWEKCVVVQFNPEFSGPRLENLMAMSPSNQVYSYLPEDVQGIGVMMCSGDVDTKDDLIPQPRNNSIAGMPPLRVRENYYYFTQIFNDGDMQDPGALFNHPWMLQLRGKSDFRKFHTALILPPKEMSWGSIVNIALNDISSFFKRIAGQGDPRMGQESVMQQVDPNDTNKALSMMSEAYSSIMPTFPGMYTYSDSNQDAVTNWPETQSSK